MGATHACKEYCKKRVTKRCKAVRGLVPCGRPCRPTTQRYSPRGVEPGIASRVQSARQAFHWHDPAPRASDGADACQACRAVPKHHAVQCRYAQPRATNLPWLVPLPYGTRPVTISYSSAPKAHTSDAVLTWPRSASGLMYGTVPQTRDSMDVRPGGSTWHCPKSHSCGRWEVGVTAMRGYVGMTN